MKFSILQPQRRLFLASCASHPQKKSAAPGEGGYIDHNKNGKMDPYENPDLPIERPTMIEFTVNQRTAAAIGIKVPSEVLLRANTVIE